MKCINCNSEFSPFVHNQTRCRTCVTLQQIKEGNLKKIANKLFHKECKWCNKQFELKTTAQLVAIPFLLLNDTLFGWLNCAQVGTWLIWIASFLTLWSMFYYMKKALPQLVGKVK